MIRYAIVSTIFAISALTAQADATVQSNPAIPSDAAIVNSIKAIAHLKGQNISIIKEQLGPRVWKCHVTYSISVPFPWGTIEMKRVDEVICVAK